MGQDRLNAPVLDAPTTSAIERFVRGATSTATVSSAATRTALALLNTSSPIYLTESGREGQFVWSSANLSTQVTADPNQGIYVAPASAPTGASGAWVRKYDGAANGLWWGATPGVGDTSAAVIAAIATLKALVTPGNPGYGNGGSRSLYYPASTAGFYNCANTLIQLSHTIEIFGDGSGEPSGGGTVFKWNDGTGGFRGIAGSNGASLRKMTLVGGFTTVEGEYHAVETDTNMKIVDIQCYDWPGEAFYESNDSAGGTGNSNGFEIDRAFAQNCRCGHFAAGGDVNAGRISGLQTKVCRRWAVMQTGFLGTMYEACSVASNALTAWNTGATGHPVSFCHSSGHWYFAIHGQETWCQTNAPSGTTANNQGWGYWRDAGVYPGVPTWFNNMVVRSGGGYLVSGLNNKSGFVNCYAEDDQVSQFDNLATRFEPFMSYAFWVSAGVLSGPASEFGGSRLVTTSAANSIMRGLQVAKAGAGQNLAVTPLTTHNNALLASTTYAKLDFAQGYEADGTTPAVMASIAGYGDSASPATTTGYLVFSTRTYSTNVLTERMVLDLNNTAFRPYVDNALDLGHASFRWRTVNGYTGNFSSNVTVADAAYGAGWSGSLQVPTKNAVYNKIQTLTGATIGLIPVSVIDLPLAITTEPLMRWYLTSGMVFTGGHADATVGATGTPSFRIRKNGVANGTVSFAGTVGTVTFTNLTYAAGDLFELYPPVTADATLDQVSITFATT